MRDALATGTVVAERYRVCSTLGIGGVGITYEAEHLQAGGRVALKQLHLWHGHQWKILDLFQRESQVLAELDHPAIPRYIDHFQVESEGGPIFYLVQELAEGTPLSSQRLGGWQPGEDTARRIASQLLDILEYLQSRQPAVVHRDIKPDNVIRRGDGHVFLVDFGAVRDIYRTTVNEGSTVVGTYGYMAPEQFRGHAVPATDLHGLAATLLFLVTGKSPADLPQRHGRVDVRRAARLSPGFSRWLQRLLDPDPDRRYSDAKSARLGLERFDRSRRFSVLRFGLMLGAGMVLAAPAVVGAALWLGPLGGSGDDAGRSADAKSRLGTAGPERTPGWAEHGRLKYIKLLSAHWSAVFEARYTPDGRYIVTGANDGATKLWDANEGTVVKAFPARGGRVGTLAVSSDGKRVVTGAADGKVRVWDVETGKLKRSFQAHRGHIPGVALTPDGALVGTGGLDGEVGLWELDSGKHLFRDKPDGQVLAVAFTPDGKLLAAGTYGGDVVLYDVERRRRRGTLKGHAKPVNDLVATPDGQSLISASDDHTVRVWLIANGATMRKLEAHDDEVWALALHPDGKTLATGCKDGTLRLWNIYSGDRLENAFGDARGIITMSFSPDGRKLLTAGGNQAGLVWALTRESWRPPVISRPVRIVEPTPDPSWPEERSLVQRARHAMDYGHDLQGASVAKPLLERAIGINPKYAPAYAEMSRAVRQLGYIRGHEYRPEAVREAHQLADRALELDPDMPLAHVRKAWVHLAANEIAQARGIAEASRKRWPTDLDVALLECGVDEREGNWDELFIDARALVDLKPEVSYLTAAYGDLLRVYRARSEWDAVDEVYRSVMNLDPESAWVRGNYAGFLVKRGRYDEAIEMAEAARRLMDYGVARGTQADAYAGKAREALRANQVDKCDEWLEKAEKLTPHSATTHYVRGTYHLRKQHPVLARSEFERALQIEPDHAEAKRALGELK